jgi:RNA polymerase sigma factor
VNAVLGLLLSISGSAPPPSGPDAALRLLSPARRGDREAREELLRLFTPLVLRVGAQVSGRYLEVGRDEEVSVGLLALNEAIDRYDPDRGASFASFCEVVIRRRLIDHYRRTKPGREIPLSELEQEDDEGHPVQKYEVREATDRFRKEEEAAERREEISRYAKRLAEFGIRFSELAEISPKHEDARERAMEAARVVASNRLYAEHLRVRRELPLKQLENDVGVSRKTLERQRKYIIAVALLYLEEFHHLRRYVSA